MEEQAKAPGCFAAASVFSHDSEMCRVCHAFQACSEESKKTLQTICQVINVEDLLERHRVAKLRAKDAMEQRDNEAAAGTPPGNLAAPMIRTAERKTIPVPVEFAPTAHEEMMIAMLPVKVQPVGVGFCKRGGATHVRECIANHTKAFSSGPEWLQIAVALLARGRFTKSELRETLKKQMGLVDKTVGPYASMAVALFKVFKLAVERDGEMVLVPATA